MGYEWDLKGFNGIEWDKHSHFAIEAMAQSKVR